MNDAVIEALQTALLSSPDPLPIRRHLALLLLEDGRHVEALAQCRAVLAERPDDAEALATASRAAAGLGDAAAATSYARVAAALGATMATTTPPAPRAGPDGDSDGDGDEEETVRGGAAGEVLPLRVLDGEGDPDAPERPSVRLDDVGGLAEVKRRLNISFLGPMRNPELRAMYGKSLRGGLLLWGPPGCGKTFIARATAGELGARFIGVGLPDVLDLYFGQSERNLHEIFERARRSAPCVVFLDELDALGAKRVNVRGQQMWRGLIAQLLNELDGALQDNEGVFVLGATNAPWDVDPALRRPGRFDRTLLVLPPDLEARQAILTYHFRDRPVEKLDLLAAARATDGFSGADLAAAAEAAAELALSESMESGVTRPIRQGDLLAALRELKPSTTAWLHTARNFALFASEGGTYDDLLDYIRERNIG